MTTTMRRQLNNNRLMKLPSHSLKKIDLEKICLVKAFDHSIHSFLIGQPFLYDFPYAHKSFHKILVEWPQTNLMFFLLVLKNCRKFEVSLFVERQKKNRCQRKNKFPLFENDFTSFATIFSSNNPQNISSIWCSFSKQLISCRTKRWNLFSCQSCNTFFNKELDINVLRQEQHCNQIGKT